MYVPRGVKKVLLTPSLISGLSINRRSQSYGKKLNFKFRAQRWSPVSTVELQPGEYVVRKLIRPPLLVHEIFVLEILIFTVLTNILALTRIKINNLFNLKILEEVTLKHVLTDNTNE